jgi:CHAT domain
MTLLLEGGRQWKPQPASRDDAYVLSAVELHRRAVEENAAGRHAQANVLLNKALERDPDHVVRARIYLSLAYAQSERGSLADGLAYCAQALALPDLPAEVRGLAHAQRALTLLRSGDGGRALNEFDRAHPLLENADPIELLRLRLNRGNVYLNHGDLERAREDFEAVIENGGLVGDRGLSAKAEHNMGYVRLLSGDLVGALRMMDSARDKLASMSPVIRAVVDQDRAEVLMSAGLIHDAALALRTAVATFGARGLHQRQGDTELLLARLLLMSGETAEARRVARRASRRFRRRGSGAWALRADLVALAAELASGRGVRLVERRAAELDGPLAELGLRDDARLASVLAAQAALRTGDVESAQSRLRRVRLPATAPAATRLFARQVRAELALEQGRRGVALRHVREGLDDLHSWQSSFGSLDLQTSLVGHGQSLAGFGLSMAIDDGRPAVVFEWFERARALAGRVAPVRPPADPDAAGALAELRRIQVELRLAESVAATDLTRRATRLREQIRRRAWYGAGGDTVVEPATLDEVRTALGTKRGALISYVVADKAIHAVVVTDQTSAVRDLGELGPVRDLLDGLRADLDVAASQLPKHLRTVVLAGLRQRLAGLSELLWEPLADAVEGRPVVVVPPGALVTVPWPMLPGLHNRPLTVARSASSWLRTREYVRPRRAGLVSGPGVPRAEEEVLQAAKAWEDVRVLTGPNAMAAEVSNLAADVDVLHVASHGRHAADNPLFSGLDLVDGPWFGYDIDRLPRVPSTVVLSACELGRSAVRWGAETIGMTVAWLHAGTACVIASPARVDDDVACDVLARTHEGLATGRAPAVALAAARAQADPDAVVPFICFGAGW